MCTIFITFGTNKINMGQMTPYFKLVKLPPETEITSTIQSKVYRRLLIWRYFIIDLRVFTRFMTETEGQEESSISFI